LCFRRPQLKYQQHKTISLFEKSSQFSR